MLKEFLLVSCVITICYAAVIKDFQPEVKSNVQENGIDEVSDNGSSDLDTADTKHFGFGPKVVVVNQGYGGYGGYGGYQRGCNCGYGPAHTSHYHYHKSYGKK